ncbi:MAG: dihydroneopterin aldolase, partial [Prochlorococcaceae cyanobacterium ETNP7_MAG_30]|nr:dihydroneopterin aldolase [Prochlorococcaceae cyanobacterium ETNP7_MAG_30]
MINRLPLGAIHVNDVRLWAHVGVLDHERRDGQWFSLDFSLWLDLDKAALNDDLNATADYSLAISAMQR